MSRPVGNEGGQSGASGGRMGWGSFRRVAREDEVGKSTFSEFLWPVFSGSYYLSVSVMLSVVNKALMQLYKFGFPLLILFLQVTVTLMIFGGLFVFRVRRLPDRNAPWRKLVMLTAAYFMNMTASMSAMNLTSLLMFNTLRRTSIVFVLLFEGTMLKRKTTPMIVLSVVIIVIGALIAGFRDMVFDVRGYLLALLANVSTSLYLVLIKKVQTETKIDSLDLLCYNSLFSWPLMLFVALMSDEASMGVGIIMDTSVHDNGFYLALAISALLGFFINHATYNNASATSPLSHTVLAVFKDVCLLFLSYVLFDRGHTSTGTIIGAVVSFLGSAIYAAANYRIKTGKTGVKVKKTKSDPVPKSPNAFVPKSPNAFVAKSPSRDATLVQMQSPPRSMHEPSMPALPRRNSADFGASP